MSETIEARVDRLVRGLMTNHVDLFGLLLADAGLSLEAQRDRLNELVRALKRRRFENTIFDGGRRVATSLDASASPPVLVLNRELLDRVDDGEILFALARPVAELLGISPLSVAIVMQAREEHHLKQLLTKSVRKLDNDLLPAVEVPAYVGHKLETFGWRMASILTQLGEGVPSNFQTQIDPVIEALRGSPGWPEWTDLSDLFFAQMAENAAAQGLRGTPYADHSSCIVELVWDSLALSSHSFLRHAARTLRGQQTPELGEVLEAFVDAMATREPSLTTELADWPAYEEVAAAWRELIGREQAIFGGSANGSVVVRNSVTAPAGEAFGLSEPKELPWELPLLCWTVREQNALRDLIVGLMKTLPAIADDNLTSFDSLYRAREIPLGIEGERRNLGVQIVSLSSELVDEEPEVRQRAWSATLYRLLDQFASLAPQARTSLLTQMRQAHDELFPQAGPIWDRRFYDLDRVPQQEAFRRLATEVQDVLRAPVLFDPFASPDDPTLLPLPTLVMLVGRTLREGKTPFWIPLSAISSTAYGAPVRVRIVAVPVASGEGCDWLCDRQLHLAKLHQQPAELMIRSVRGDALKMAVFD